METNNLPDVQACIDISNMAINLVDTVVFKRYLASIRSLKPISPLSRIEEEETKASIVLYKVNKMVYEKDEFATDKFISVISAMTYAQATIFLIIDGHRDGTDFYIGVRNEDEQKTAGSVAETLRNAMLGQFPGADISKASTEMLNMKKKIFARMNDNVASISSCVGVPSYRNNNGTHDNASYIQGIEKFVNAMQGKDYTAVILASNIASNEIAEIRHEYESLFSSLSAIENKQLAYSTNESLANAFSRTIGTSHAHNTSTSNATSDGASFTQTLGRTSSDSQTESTGESKMNAVGKVGKTLAVVGGVLGSAAALAIAGPAAAPVVMGVGAAIGAAPGTLMSTIGGKTLNKNKSVTKTETTSKTDSEGITHTETITTTEGDTDTESFSETDGTTTTIGSTKTFTINLKDKHVLEIQKKIESQLERIGLCEGTGLWSAGSFFLSYGDDRATAETGATIFRSLLLGENSGVESSAINTWYKNENSSEQFKNVHDSIRSFTLPVFQQPTPFLEKGVYVQASSMLNSNEVAMMFGLPRKSVPGLPVTDHAALAKEVIQFERYGNRTDRRIELGCIFDMGTTHPSNKVSLDLKSLAQHTFVTGSTGSGKSNTVYYLLSQILKQPDRPNFLIIEPAKGEYKNIFGDFNVYGTNPNKTPLLRINPFRFPEGVHVLEHIDRLVEIFNVCWPMYAAMPAVLKEAVLNAYEKCGWDLYSSTNIYSDQLFPTFADLLDELVNVIETSAYSSEVKGNYQGSLVTRVKSLTNGLNKAIFCGKDLGDKSLFDEDVIIDLSRVGSQETKALIMGVLIMRLNEYRANSGIESNSDIRHITILEEAHNILKRCSTSQDPESSNVAGKSVEMLSNSIAEVRTYGEGFIIVDQSPGAVDISAIRNTNTKIVMRLPEESDRHVAGKASAMKDEQISEIAKLPTGVAVVYQNDWEEPVLCKINEYTQTPIKYEPRRKEKGNGKDLKSDVLCLLLSGMIVDNPFDMNSLIATVRDYLPLSDFSTYDKIHIYRLMSSIEKSHKPTLWYKSEFSNLAALVARIVAKQEEVNHLANGVSDFNALDERIKELVEERVGALDERLYAAIESCLMKTYSTSCDAANYIYKAWCNKNHRLL